MGKYPVRICNTTKHWLSRRSVFFLSSRKIERRENWDATEADGSKWLAAKVQLIIPLESEIVSGDCDSWERERWDVMLVRDDSHTLWLHDMYTDMNYYLNVGFFFYIYIYIYILYYIRRAREETQRARICTPIYITTGFSRCEWMVEGASIQYCMSSSKYSI